LDDKLNRVDALPGRDRKTDGRTDNSRQQTPRLTRSGVRIKTNSWFVYHISTDKDGHWMELPHLV